MKPAAVAAQGETALAQSWSEKLSDTRITLEQDNSPPGTGYGAGTPYSSSESFLYLYRGHRYRLLKIGKIGGMSVGVAYLEPRETSKESEGEWKIQVRGGAAILVLTDDNGGEDYYRIEKAASDSLKVDRRERAWRPL